jgi:hypothetical protein
MNRKPWCCVEGCDNDATWQIWHGDGPDDNTQVCDQHLLELLPEEPDNVRFYRGQAEIASAERL